MFSPVVRLETLQFLLVFGVLEDYEMEQMDVTTAFLNGPEDVAELLMEQPEGYVVRGKEQFVC